MGYLCPRNQIVVMRIPLIFLSFGLFFSSCANELYFENIKLNKKSTLLCKVNCPEIKLNIPLAKTNSATADSINKRVFAVVRDLVKLDETPITKEDYSTLMESFIASYEEAKNEFPESTFGWEAAIAGEIKYESEALINIEIEHYTFTGGAHGYSGLQSLLIDPKTGNVIPNESLFNNMNSFKKMVEEKFRIKYKIPLEGSINQTGYFFPNNEFELPKNIFYTRDGLLLHYNQYEIAAYAEGPKNLFLPFTILKEYLVIK